MKYSGGFTKLHIIFLLALITLILSSVIFAATGKNSNRVALVVGNSAYINSPLKNPVNDAKDIATKLRKLGFEVIERNNLTTKQIGGTLREFRSKLAPGAVALVFYAGHGLQIKGINYLPAVDADINSEEDVPNQSIAVNQIMDVLEESKSRLNLVFLDACRNNPYARSFRTADRGLARVNAPSGTLISYATKPGSVAADGDGRNGLYTSKLLAQMDSNQQIEQSLKRVVTEVKAASKGKQEPWMEGSIEGDFCFGGCAGNSGTSFQATSVGAVSAKAGTSENPEKELWTEVQKGNSKEDYEAYLTHYPKGKYAVLAKSRINKLNNEVVAGVRRKEQEKKDNNVDMTDKLLGGIWSTASGTLIKYTHGELVVTFASSGASQMGVSAGHVIAKQCGFIEDNKVICLQKIKESNTSLTEAWVKVEISASPSSLEMKILENPFNKDIGPNAILRRVE